MALLQAARAYVLGLPMESAYSWGLNRATFIAAAKRGFKSRPGSGSGGNESKGSSRSKGTYFLGGGDDMAYKTERGGVLLFTFGGKVQTREEFDKRVRARFGDQFPVAWKEALACVKKFDKDTLLSAEGFFREVYKPVRDSFADELSSANQITKS
jgi:hypothetical protein